MKLKILCIASVFMLLIGQFLLSQGPDFMYSQHPIDFAHWFILVGACLSISYSFVFPKSIFNTIATVLTILGIIAHIGMCSIDFVLWSFGDNYEARDELIKHLLNVPVIWLPFMVIGPACLYIGLSTHIWKFIKSHTISSLITLGGSLTIGVGQMVLRDINIVVIGCLVFSIGLTLLLFRKSF